MWEKNKTQFQFENHEKTNKNSSKSVTIQGELNIPITLATGLVENAEKENVEN
jgi:hypothetical protein